MKDPSNQEGAEWPEWCRSVERVLSDQESAEQPWTTPSKSYGSIGWTFSSNHWAYLLNRHVSNSIFDVFLVLGIHGTIRVAIETLCFPFFSQNVQPIQRFLSYRPKHDAMYLLCADDDWLPGAYQMHTQNSRKARPDPASASHKICWAWDPQAWYKSGVSNWAQQKGPSVIYLGSAPGPFKPEIRRSYHG